MNKFLKFIFVGLVIVILIIAAHYLGWLRPLENLAVRIASPFEEKFYSWSSGARSFYNSWLSRRDLLAENSGLKNQLEKYQLDQTRINSLTEENEVLKKELNFSQASGLKFTAAKIITGVSDPLSQSVVIDRGKKDGLVKGLAVVAEGGVLVGKIQEVGDNYSKVLLLTDGQSKVAATIQNLNRTVGLVEGQFGLSLAMTDIPQDQEIKEGDLVVTSGLEGQIPKNLLMARVDSVSQQESEIFKTAILSPIISFDNLSYVLVITP